MPEEIFEKLKEKIRMYNKEADLEMLDKAFLVAKNAHENQIRRSGEPYILHPIETSIIIAELELDMESIVAGILHDVVEDTDLTLDDIKREFSDEVAGLVYGVTKLTNLTYQNATTVDKEEIQAENYRRMFIAMSDDIRVILIKLADRLHNMRTLKYLSEDKQKEIAKETLAIYAPLANRLGISKIKTELEDLSLRFMNPEVYYDLVNKINIRKAEREAVVNNIIKTLEKEFEISGIQGTIQGRAKHFYSIYKKMYEKNRSIDEIYDLFAVRAIVNSVRDCYEVLGIMHELYKPMPGRFKDYIAMPKANMYQSLHSTLLDLKGNPFEIQIRTYDMHRVAENGIAAHWMYKEGKASLNDKLAEKLGWLREVAQWKKESNKGKEFVENVKVDLSIMNEEVYVFSPRGDVIALPQGSTPIDFAYYIHSAVGNKMVGAKVNDRIVNLNYKLKTGDRVEILTSQNNKGPSKDWLNFVVSTQAKSKINMWFKNLSKEESIEKGKQLLEDAAIRKGVKLDMLLKDEWKEAITSRYGLKSFEVVYSLVGHGDMKESQIINRLYGLYEKENNKSISLEAVLEKSVNSHGKSLDRKRQDTIIVDGIDDVALKNAKCCNPIPGDEIVGFITKGRGISVHRTDCKNIMALSRIDRERLLEAVWSSNIKEGVYYPSEVKIIAEDRSGIILEISKTINDHKIPLKAMDAKVINKNTIIVMTIEVTNKEQLEKVCNNIRNIRGVSEILRISG